MILGELFRMAVSAIWSHKLRSSLTLVGIIAGVASIIGVMTGISVIQSTIEGELSVLGSTVFQVQKWASGGPMSREEWLKIMRRRPPLKTISATVWILFSSSRLLFRHPTDTAHNG